MNKTENLRIKISKAVASPALVTDELPMTQKISELVLKTRQAVHNILNREDDRLIVVVGPCSVHDVNSAKEYATRLHKLNIELQDDLLIIMRVYFEKPRTSIGWKGLINDPDLDGTFNINKGIRLARQLLLEIGQIGLPAGTEFLDVITPQYIADLISWGAIGARTTESQIHRQLSSGLSCAIGFKNGTHGDLQIAIEAIKASSKSHNFLSVTRFGSTAIFTTSGNDDCHIILRGGSQSPNYDAEAVNDACKLLKNNSLNESVMIDFAHANCCQNYSKQVEVAEDVAKQISTGDSRIIGVMCESNLNEGKQDINRPKLEYGVSITDGCIGWDDTEKSLRNLAQAVKMRRLKNNGKI